MTNNDIFLKLAEHGISALATFLMYRVTMKALDLKKVG